MSSWVVSKSHIDVLVSALRAFKVEHNLGRDPVKIGRALWRENVESVAYNYQLRTRDDGRKDEMAHYERAIEAYTFRELHDLKPGAVVKAAHCFDYQSCDHPAWEASEACRTMARLVDKLAQSLPGYEAAPWGVDEDRLADFCNPALVSLTSLMSDGRGPVRKLRG